MKVYLIGAGPGDAGLLTLKGRDALACADVVVYDALANDSLLGHARPDAELGRAVVGDGQHRLGNGCKAPAAALCHRDAKHSFVSPCV